MITSKIKLKITYILIIALLALSIVGCTNKPQYGDWQLLETGNPDTHVLTSFPYPIVVTIEYGGNIYLQGDLFGVVKQKRQTYSFVQTIPVGNITELISQEGIWQIKNEADGTIALYIYPSNEKIVYKLTKLS